MLYYDSMFERVLVSVSAAVVIFSLGGLISGYRQYRRRQRHRRHHCRRPGPCSCRFVGRCTAFVTKVASLLFAQDSWISNLVVDLYDFAGIVGLAVRAVGVVRWGLSTTPHVRTICTRNGLFDVELEEEVHDNRLMDFFWSHTERGQSYQTLYWLARLIGAGQHLTVIGRVKDVKDQSWATFTILIDLAAGSFNLESSGWDSCVGESHRSGRRWGGVTDSLQTEAPSPPSKLLRCDNIRFPLGSAGVEDLLKMLTRSRPRRTRGASRGMTLLNRR